MSKELKILVVGDPIIDRYWYCTPKGTSPEAPILTWNVDRIVDKPGGAANVVNNLCGLTNIYDYQVDISFIGLGSPELEACIPKNFPTKGLFVTHADPVIKNRIIFENPADKRTEDYITGRFG